MRDSSSELAKRLDEASAEMTDEASASGRALALLLEASSISALSIGVCRIGNDPAPLRPVLTTRGLRWECTHEPVHASKDIAALDGQ